MSERKFKCYNNVITMCGFTMSTFSIVDKLNEQQADIKKLAETLREAGVAIASDYYPLPDLSIKCFELANKHLKDQ